MNIKIMMLLLGLIGCAPLPKVDSQAGSSSAIEHNPGDLTNAIARSSQHADSSLTEEILFDFLLAETALQRDRLDISAESYARLAHITRDARIAERAADIALRTRQPALAQEAIDLWVTLEPQSQAAHQAAVILFIDVGQLNRARPHLEKLLASQPDAVGKSFMQINKLLSRHPDKQEALTLVRQLARSYDKLPEAHFAVSQAAWAADQPKLASDAMQKALKLRPEWEMAAIHQGRILQKLDNPAAINFYKRYLDQYSKANDLRIAYIRALMENKKFSLAREQFHRLESENASNPDIALAIGLLSAELDDYGNAERYFKKALELGFEDTNSVNFNLGRIYETSQRNREAMDSYRRVTGGERYIPAQIRYAFLLAGQDGLTPARQHLQTVRYLDEEQRIQLILSEAQLLREQGANPEAYDLLSTQLDKTPQQPEILYDRALIAEKLGKLDILEQDLRKLIELKPDSAHAYNALGYSLADRGLRLPEALSLIQKAIELSPDDPYIMDSLGWAYYRMGNLKKGLDYLNTAFAARPDPEIAAHFGELLWMNGRTEEAKQIWQSALDSHPGNEVLQDTMKRFIP
ncbi:MAG TPA: tetratricopeptide repeat protein [Nitrosomonas mobilis]|nr:tetratricopeptide repeat protein [Nitrosomonas mobilis]